MGVGKVLVIGNFCDSTGWSNFCLNQLLAMDSVGVDVVPRIIKLNREKPRLPERFNKLLQKSDSNPDAVIQIVLPQYIEFCGKIKQNIGYFLVETDRFLTSNWATKLNLMDSVWVPCTHNEQSASTSGVVKPIRKVPMAIDFSKYTRSYPLLPLRSQFKDDYIFYTIGELNTRKNVQAIIRAFHTEFSPHEPVQLVIKTTPVGLGDNPQNTINEMLLQIRRGLKLYVNENSYKREIIFCESVPDEVISGLHLSCDCFVSASMGESINVPALDAMGFGRDCVLPQHSGFGEYVSDKNAYVLDSYKDAVFGFNHSFQDLYTGDESVDYVTINSLRRQMRYAFEMRNTFISEEKRQNAVRTVQEFSYEKVGNHIRNILEGENSSV